MWSLHRSEKPTNRVRSPEVPPMKKEALRLAVIMALTFGIGFVCGGVACFLWVLGG